MCALRFVLIFLERTIGAVLNKNLADLLPCRKKKAQTKRCQVALGRRLIGVAMGQCVSRPHELGRRQFEEPAEASSRAQNVNQLQRRPHSGSVGRVLGRVYFSTSYSLISQNTYFKKKIPTFLFILSIEHIFQNKCFFSTY